MDERERLLLIPENLKERVLEVLAHCRTDLAIGEVYNIIIELQNLEEIDVSGSGQSQLAEDPKV